MVLEIYLDLFSQPCRSVYIFAKKNNISFEFNKVSLFDGEQYGEKFGNINQVRKVPAIKDGDFCLSESTAIMKYMAQKFQTPDHWFPADLMKRARVNEYLSWQHMNLRTHGSRVLWLRLMSSKMGIDVPKEKMDIAVEDLNNSLNLLEEKFIQDKPFIVGEQISLADLVAMVEIMHPVGSGLDVFEERPKLSAWRDRVVAAIGPELFDEAHQAVLRAREMDGSKLQKFKQRFIRMFM